MNSSSKSKLNPYDLMKHCHIMRKLSTVKERDDEMIIASNKSIAWIKVPEREVIDEAKLNEIEKFILSVLNKNIPVSSVKSQTKTYARYFSITSSIGESANLLKRLHSLNKVNADNLDSFGKKLNVTANTKNQNYSIFHKNSEDLESLTRVDNYSSSKMFGNSVLKNDYEKRLTKQLIEIKYGKSEWDAYLNSHTSSKNGDEDKSSKPFCDRFMSTIGSPSYTSNKDAKHRDSLNIQNYRHSNLRKEESISDEKICVQFNSTTNKGIARSFSRSSTLAGGAVNNSMNAPKSYINFGKFNSIAKTDFKNGYKLPKLNSNNYNFSNDYRKHHTNDDINLNFNKPPSEIPVKIKPNNVQEDNMNYIRIKHNNDSINNSKNNPYPTPSNSFKFGNNFEIEKKAEPVKSSFKRIRSSSTKKFSLSKKIFAVNNFESINEELEQLNPPANQIKSESYNYFSPIRGSSSIKHSDFNNKMSEVKVRFDFNQEIDTKKEMPNNKSKTTTTLKKVNFDLFKHMVRKINTPAERAITFNLNDSIVEDLKTKDVVAERERQSLKYTPTHSEMNIQSKVIYNKINNNLSEAVPSSPYLLRTEWGASFEKQSFNSTFHLKSTITDDSNKRRIIRLLLEKDIKYLDILKRFFSKISKHYRYENKSKTLSLVEDLNEGSIYFIKIPKKGKGLVSEVIVKCFNKNSKTSFYQVLGINAFFPKQNEMREDDLKANKDYFTRILSNKNGEIFVKPENSPLPSVSEIGHANNYTSYKDNPLKLNERLFVKSHDSNLNVNNYSQTPTNNLANFSRDLEEEVKGLRKNEFIKRQSIFTRNSIFSKNSMSRLFTPHNLYNQSEQQIGCSYSENSSVANSEIGTNKSVLRTDKSESNANLGLTYPVKCKKRFSMYSLTNPNEGKNLSPHSPLMIPNRLKKEPQKSSKHLNCERDFRVTRPFKKSSSLSGNLNKLSSGKSSKYKGNDTIISSKTGRTQSDQENDNILSSETNESNFFKLIKKMKAEASDLAVKLNVNPKSFKNSKLRSKKEIRSDIVSGNTQEASDIKFDISATKNKLENIEETEIVQNASFRSISHSEDKPSE